MHILRKEKGDKKEKERKARAIAAHRKSPRLLNYRLVIQGTCHELYEKPY
jgi:hypothetical protein